MVDRMNELKNVQTYYYKNLSDIMQFKQKVCFETKGHQTL